MNSVLGPFHAFARVYLDDVIIFSKSAEEHAEHVRSVLEALRKNELRLNPDKCVFGVKQTLSRNYFPGACSVDGSRGDGARQGGGGAAMAYPYNQETAAIVSWVR